ncbi:hypothetical protein OXX69_004864 [Metschnikowia pulcherrima]
MTQEETPWGRENAKPVSSTSWIFRKIPQEIAFFNTMSREQQLVMIYAKTGINTGRSPPTDLEIEEKVMEWKNLSNEFAKEEKIKIFPSNDVFLVTIDI